MKKFDIITTIGILTFFIVFTAIASTYSWKASMAPVTIGILGIIISLIQLFGRNIKWLKSLVNEESEREEPGKQYKLRLLRISLWLVAMFLLLYLLGFFVGLPLFLFLFLIFEERENKVLAISSSVGLWALIYFFFSKFLEIPFLPGIIQELFN